jgi:hypothetical protein
LDLIVTFTYIISQHQLTFLLRYSLLVLVTLSLVTCKHECPDPYSKGCNGCDYDQSIEGMKEWYYFKTGSWWVYQEESTGELDTITVYNHWEGPTGEGYEGFLWNAEGSFDGYRYFHQFSSSFSNHCLNQDNCTCHKLLREKSIPGDYIGGARMFAYPLILGNYLNISGAVVAPSTSTVIGSNSSIELLGEEYHNVSIWDVTIDASEHDKHTRYSFAKNIGIIRREIVDDGKVWLLKERSVIQ